MPPATWAQHVALNTWHAIKITVETNGDTQIYIDDMNSPKSVWARDPNYARGGLDWCFVIGNFDGDIDELRISTVLP
jgi:hypothetical protein